MSWGDSWYNEFAKITIGGRCPLGCGMVVQIDGDGYTWVCANTREARASDFASMRVGGKPYNRHHGLDLIRHMRKSGSFFKQIQKEESDAVELKFKAYANVYRREHQDWNGTFQASEPKPAKPKEILPPEWGEECP